MSVGIFSTTKIIVQGITGKEGSFHAKMCKKYGSRIVAGVSPSKGNSKIENIPVYSTVSEAVAKHNPDMSLIFVPPLFASDAILEAISSGIKTIVCITEGIPVHDMMKIKKIAKLNNITLIGPNCPGIITPGSAKAGIMPGNIFKKGTIGMLSRSGTLLYEATDQIVKKGFGISTAIGIGGDPIIGSDFVDWLDKFEQDSETEAVVLIGEIGGDAEERAAKFIKTKMTKPVVAFIAGRTAPQGKRMGHAGAIISGNSGTVESKDKAFKEANVLVAKKLSEIGETLKKRLEI